MRRPRLPLGKEYAEFFAMRDLPFTPDDTYWDDRARSIGKEHYAKLRESLLTGDGALAAECWHRHGGAIIDAWSKRQPGTRPLCWWRFTSPLKRIPERHPADPNLVRTAPDRGYGEEYETQAEYLARNGLLSAHELKVLDRR